MISSFDLERQVEWQRERMLAEAESERTALQARTLRRQVLRARAAATLYALADWLNRDERPRDHVLSRLETA
jgi:hypothetical protein